jgi:hypothetical protein
MISCQDKKITEDIYSLSEMEIRFLNQSLPDNLKSADYNAKQTFIQKITKDLERQNKEKRFIKNYVEKYGYPDWQMVRWFKSNGETVAHIPLFFDNGTETQAVMLAVEYDNKIKFRLFERDNFEKYAKNKKPVPSAEIIKNLFIIFDFQKFGESSYLPKGYFVVSNETPANLKSTAGYFYDDCFYVATYYGEELIRIYEDCATYYIWGGDEMAEPETSGGDAGDASDPSGVEPAPIPLDPCNKIKFLISDLIFKEKMTSLKNSTNLDYEQGYLITLNTIGEQNYSYIQGNSNELEIKVSVFSPINGYIHCHIDDDKSLSTFSVGDIKTIYDLYQANLIQDMSTFFIGVTTTQGTSYTLHLNDLNLFDIFGSNNLLTKNDSDSLENEYNLYFTAFKFLHNEIEARELALLEILKNAGLVLTKENILTGEWLKIENQNYNIITIKCN